MKYFRRDYPMCANSFSAGVDGKFHFPNSFQYKKESGATIFIFHDMIRNLDKNLFSKTLPILLKQICGSFSIINSLRQRLMPRGWEALYMARKCRGFVQLYD